MGKGVGYDALTDDRTDHETMSLINSPEKLQLPAVQQELSGYFGEMKKCEYDRQN